jgi:two-component system response regulator FixJ
MAISISTPESAPMPALSIMSAADPKDFAQASPNGCAPDRVSVCLLDDDLSMLKALGRLLTCEGFLVEKFNRPAAFLSAIGEAPRPVVILDVWMPDMNGLEVQEALRQESPNTRIIFISGRDDPSVRQAALDAGAFGFLSKPFDDEKLVQLVRQAAGAVSAVR